jgi:hypothetical protein
MDEIKVANFLYAVNIGAPVLAFILSVYCLYFHLSGDVVNGNIMLLPVSLIFQYSCCLVFTLTPVRPSIFCINVLNSLLMLVLIGRSLVSRSNPYFFIMLSARAGLRVLMGLLALSFRHSLCWNVIVSVALCHQYSLNYDVFPKTALNAYHYFSFYLIEICNFAVVAVVLYLMEKGMEESVRATLHARASDNAKCAVDRLLSVLCDGDLHVGLDLRIAGPSSKLQHLLSSPLDGPCPDLEGCNIMRFIAEKDHRRFHDFLASARSHCGDSEDQRSSLEFSSGTAISHAASIPVEMLDAAGRPFPVDLFQVNLQDLYEQPGYLVGIRESGVRGALGQELEALVPTHRRISAEGTSQISEHGPSLVQPDIAVNSPESAPIHHEPQKDDEESSSSSSLPSSAAGWAGAALPELEYINVTFDAFSPRWAIQEVTFAFVSLSDNIQEQVRVPQFADWMPVTFWDAFHPWVQEHVNAAFANEPAKSLSKTAGPFQVWWPGGSSGDRDILNADTVELIMPEVDGDDIPDPMLLQFQMSGLSHIPSLHAHRRRKRRVHKLPSIGESGNIDDL